MAPRESATTSLQARYGKWERQSSVWCWILWVTGRESVLPKKTSAVPMLMWSAFLSSEIWRGCCEKWNDCIWNETNHVANKSASVLSLLNPNDRITSFWCIIETLFPFVLFILSFLIIHSTDPLSLNNLPSSPWTPPFLLFLLNASAPPPLSKTILLSLIASVFVVPRGFQLNASLHSSRGTAKISFIQLLFREFHRTFGLQFLNDYWIFKWVLLSQSVKGAQVFSCSVGPPGEVHCSTTLVILDSLYSHFNCVSVASSIQIFIMCIHYWFHSRVKYSRLTRLCVNRLIGYCC